MCFFGFDDWFARHVSDMDMDNLCQLLNTHSFMKLQKIPPPKKNMPTCSPEELDAWKTTFLLVIDSNCLGHFTVSSTTIVLLEMPYKPYKNLQKINWALQLPIWCCRCQKIQRDFTNFKNQLSPDPPWPLHVLLMISSQVNGPRFYTSCGVVKTWMSLWWVQPLVLATDGRRDQAKLSWQWKIHQLKMYGILYWKYENGDFPLLWLSMVTFGSVFSGIFW